MNSFDWGKWWENQIADTAAAASEWRANWVRRELGLYSSPSPDSSSGESQTTTEIERPTEEPRESVSTLAWVALGAVAVIALVAVLK